MSELAEVRVFPRSLVGGRHVGLGKRRRVSLRGTRVSCVRWCRAAHKKGAAGDVTTREDWTWRTGNTKS